MRILFVLENFYPHIGGVEVVFKNLCEGLVKKGHQVDVVTHRMEGSKKFEKINGINIHRVSCFANRYIFTFFSIPKIVSLAKKADLIHTTTFNAAPPSWLASKLTGKKVVLTVHEVWIGKWRKLTDFGKINSFVHEILERAVFSLNYDHFICVSKSTSKALKKIKRKNIDVVYNGVDYDHFNPKKYLESSKKIRKNLGNENRFVFMTYGRPGPSKGIEYAVKAAFEVFKKIPESRMVLILSKDPAYQKKYNEIVNMIETSGFRKNFLLLDPQPWKDIPSYLLSADCVVVPSLAEGFGFSAAESCALGVPVVASKTTSLPEVVSGKYILVEPRNSEMIAKGILDAKKEKYNKSPPKKFLWKDNIEKTLEIYRKILS